MAAEKAHAEQPDPLTMLGQVSPPAPKILDRAREALWSAVAAEMLAPPSAGATQTTGTAREATGTVHEAGSTARETGGTAREHGHEG
jgi:hypothetical protein